MATNQTFIDFVTPVPADWLNNVNTVVNEVNTTFPVNNLSVAGTLSASTIAGTTITSSGTIATGDDSTKVATTHYNNVQRHSILAYGGKNDGVTDNTIALNLAFATAAQFSGRLVIYFPAGVYVFSSFITYTFPTTSASIVLVGDGPDITELRWTGNTSALEFDYLGAFNSVHIRDMSITTSHSGGNEAIHLKQTAASVPNPANSAPNDITNVTFRGSDGYLGSFCWGTCIDVFAVSSVNYTNCVFVGNSGAVTGTGVDLHGLNVGCQGVVANFSNCIFQFVNIGIVYREWFQGVAVSNTNFTGNGIGIQSPSNVGGTDQLLVSNCQFNQIIAGIETVSPVSAVQISNNLFIMQVPSAVGILMPQYSTSTIVGNVFNGTAAGGQVGVQLGTKFGSNGVMITGNNFFNLSVAVNLLNTSSATNVQSNLYAGNLTNVNNLGAGNTIGGGSS